MQHYLTVGEAHRFMDVRKFNKGDHIFSKTLLEKFSNYQLNVGNRLVINLAEELEAKVHAKGEVAGMVEV